MINVQFNRECSKDVEFEKGKFQIFFTSVVRYPLLLINNNIDFTVGAKKQRKRVKKNH